MKDIKQPFETSGHDLTGHASLDLRDDINLKSLVSIFPGMDINNFEPVALKLFVSGEGLLFTLYAKPLNINESSSDGGKLPVRKFKVPLPLSDLFKYVKSFDLVVHEGKFDLSDMEVDRK